jgi:hypothetical protein
MFMASSLTLHLQPQEVTASALHSITAVTRVTCSRSVALLPVHRAMARAWRPCVPCAQRPRVPQALSAPRDPSPDLAKVPLLPSSAPGTLPCSPQVTQKLGAALSKKASVLAWSGGSLVGT